MDNPTFIDEEEAIPLTQVEDYEDDYRTPDISRNGKASFMVPDTSGQTSTQQLRQKVKLDTITALYKHLNVTGDPDLVSLDRFMIKKIQKQATLTCFFLW